MTVFDVLLWLPAGCTVCGYSAGGRNADDSKNLCLCTGGCDGILCHEGRKSKMKKYLNYSLVYAVAAMVGGVFYREFTKCNGYTGVTRLGKVHTHLFMLGMVVFLIVSLFAGQYELKDQKMFRVFLGVYNVGVPITAIMMVVRGITEVKGISLSAAAGSAISGIAGIGHILTGIGIVLLLLSLKKCVVRNMI